MPIISGSDQNIKQAAEIIRQHDIVGMPTETVYGLAANCFDEEALNKIFQTKQRPPSDPLIVHISSLEQLPQVCTIEDDKRLIVDKLIESFWPGPLTIVLKKSPQIPYLCTAQQETVGIRFPRHLIAQQLITASGCPLAAPSANRFGHVSPTRAQHVQDDFPDLTIINGDQSEIGIESTVLTVLDNNKIKIFRRGHISEQQIMDLFARENIPIVLETQKVSTSSLNVNFTAPGQHLRHYAVENCFSVFIIPNYEQIAGFQNSSQVTLNQLKQKVEDSKQVAIINTSKQFFEANQHELLKLLEINEHKCIFECINDNPEFSYFASLRKVEFEKVEVVIQIPPTCGEVKESLLDKIYRSCSGHYCILK